VSRPKVLVVEKRSLFAEIDRAGDGHAARLLRAGHPTLAELEHAHRAHEETLAEVAGALESLGADVRTVSADRVRGEVRAELVVTVGGDGTLLSTSHAVGPNVPVLGINSAPRSSVGFFCGASKGSARKAIAAALDGRLRRTSLARLRVDKEGLLLHRRVLNDVLFCHASPAATSRYLISCVRRGKVVEEAHRSSGVWMGPAAGSTAAMRSAGGKVLPLRSRAIQWVVREPYRPRGAPLRLAKGLVAPGATLRLVSQMEDGRLYVDGPHTMWRCELGEELSVRLSEEPLTVLGLGDGVGPGAPATKRRRV
jgi:NAD+ kinase